MQTCNEEGNCNKIFCLKIALGQKKRTLIPAFSSRQALKEFQLLSSIHEIVFLTVPGA